MKKINLQIASTVTPLPTTADFKRWVTKTLPHQAYEITIRIVDSDESTLLNNTYRGKNSPTNILTFPIKLPPGVSSSLLGDLVICAPLVEKEAIAQHKELWDHFAHLTIHGTLHLVGYDHETLRDAKQMEAKEIAILQQLGFGNPYV